MGRLVDTKVLTLSVKELPTRITMLKALQKAYDGEVLVR